MKGLTDILLLGDARLYQSCEPLSPDDSDLIASMTRDLHNALVEFRDKYRAGRAIAAPQLGYMKRLVYMYVDGKSTIFINPNIIGRSEETIVLWDDCMSLPNLLVQLRRHRSIRLQFYDENWQVQEWELTDDLSELLQHELDHLDGILCTMRAIDERSFRWKPTPHMME
ncbi:peptide deformylase [Persicitalea jodogahamensis]|uniref:Peptide deformylase n=1 Tax=Persicitalea jodogahamensis TaxID=402147 RepID=A0A8J3G973_9BACT|nr:peptide deformylase [Persicitalea jodogahamensis]GHB61164.1 peptide deformylase [Persicitalea jodogahamensis]